MAKRTETITDIATKLAKMTVKGMTPKELKEWEKIFKDI